MFRRQVLPVLLSVALVVYPVLPASAAAKPAPSSVLLVKLGALSGTVKTTVGKPIQKMQIVLLDQKGKAITKTVTDKSGKFALGKIGEGKYQLALGKGRLLPLHVAATGTISKVNVVLADEGAPMGGGGPLNLDDQTFQFIVIVGIATAIVLGVLLPDDDDDVRVYVSGGDTMVTTDGARSSSTTTIVNVTVSP